MIQMIISFWMRMIALEAMMTANLLRMRATMETKAMKAMKTNLLKRMNLVSFLIFKIDI